MVNPATKAGRWWFAVVLATAVTGGRAHAQESQHTSPTPTIEDYATIESLCDGVPVYSFANLIYVLGQSPDFYPGLAMQSGNERPVVKFRPKKSWEIKHNYAGSEHEMTVRSPWNDSHPALPIHLIDGDAETVWSSWGCAIPDGRPEWVRIDLPLETNVASVALVCSREFSQRYPPHGSALPNHVEVRLSRDGAHWETVYENPSFVGDASGRTEIAFPLQPAKQIWVVGEGFPERGAWMGHIFSLGELEVHDAAGHNVAVVARGAGVTVSSTSYGLLNDRFTQDALWGPLQYDLGNKWVRVGPDNGSFTWNYVEIDKGRLQIDPRADASITECVRNGIQVIMVLDFKGNWRYQDPPRKTNWREARWREFNDNYSDPPEPVFQSPEMFEAYLRYIDYMTRQFSDRVAYFEIGNEWNWIGAEQYMKQFFEPTYAAIKKVAPHAKIMLGSTAGDLGSVSQLILDCLGQEHECGSKDGRLPVRGGDVNDIRTCTMVVADNVCVKDVAVTVDAQNRGQSGILLRYQDPDNFLLATYAPHLQLIFFHERVDGKWGEISAPVSVPALGPELHLAAKVEGARAEFSLSDGQQTVATSYAVGQLLSAGAVGLGQFTFEQAFDNFRVADGDDQTLYQEDFGGTQGTVPAGLRYTCGIHGPNPIPQGWGPRIDAIGWHPTDYPDQSYFEAVKELKRKCESLGFRGRYFATEIYAGASYPPGQPTEMQMAKYLLRSLSLHSGMDMEAGPCHPHFTAFPHPQSLARQTWPAQTLVPCQPSIAYYTWRNAATVLDDFYAREFPVVFRGTEGLTCVTLESGDKSQRLVAAWLPAPDADDPTQTVCDVVLSGVHMEKAWGIDIVNGTEQELTFVFEGEDTVLPGIAVKDYPTYLRIKGVW